MNFLRHLKRARTKPLTVTPPDLVRSLESFTWLLARAPQEPIPTLVSSKPPVHNDDDALVERVATAYQHSNADFQPSGSFWDKAFFDLKSDIHNALLVGGQEAADVLRNPAESTFFWGFDAISKAPPGQIEPHEHVARMLNKTLGWEQLYATWLLDSLNSLAEAVGARPVVYPEMAPEQITSHYQQGRGANEILDDIESAIGIMLSFPNPFPQELGIETTRGIVGYRAIQAAYQAWRIGQIADGSPDFKVLEIGAGLGRTAHMASLFGIKNYTIIDIPLTNAAQGYFLGRATSPTDITLYGEDTNGPLRILPPSFLYGTDEKFDLVVNVDSLTELWPEQATKYWQFARTQSRAFLSINHEVNSFTFRTLYSKDPMIKSTRYPYWMRRGYVEELVTWA